MSYDEDGNFPVCDSLVCDLLWGHTGFHGADCWHFKLRTGECIRHQYSCAMEGIGCGEFCECNNEDWEPDFDEG